MTDAADAAEVAVRRRLDQLDVEVEIVPCDPEQADTAAVLRAIPGVEIVDDLAAPARAEQP